MWMNIIILFINKYYFKIICFPQLYVSFTVIRHVRGFLVVNERLNVSFVIPMKPFLKTVIGNFMKLAKICWKKFIYYPGMDLL
jgi:hypothetical protein